MSTSCPPRTAVRYGKNAAVSLDISQVVGSGALLLAAPIALAAGAITVTSPYGPHSGGVSSPAARTRTADGDSPLKSAASSVNGGRVQLMFNLGRSCQLP